MKRILIAYGGRFRALLVRVGARRLEKGVEWFFQKAAQLPSGSESLEALCQKTRKRIARFAARTQGRQAMRPVVFVCDVGLGGLARWLRAAGYMVYWREGVGDAELVQEARNKGAILLTTDSGMMERRVLRNGTIPSLWVSPGLTKFQQLQSVLAELQLPLLPSRCMACGGELRRVEKEAVAGRIPSKTGRWLDDYFLCQSCGKLFWHGTHWKRITQKLQTEKGS